MSKSYTNSQKLNRLIHQFVGIAEDVENKEVLLDSSTALEQFVVIANAIKPIIDDKTTMAKECCSHSMDLMKATLEDVHRQFIDKSLEVIKEIKPTATADDEDTKERLQAIFDLFLGARDYQNVLYDIDCWEKHKQEQEQNALRDQINKEANDAFWEEQKNDPDSDDRKFIEQVVKIVGEDA